MQSIVSEPDFHTPSFRVAPSYRSTIRLFLLLSILVGIWYPETIVLLNLVALNYVRRCASSGDRTDGRRSFNLCRKTNTSYLIYTSQPQPTLLCGNRREYFKAKTKIIFSLRRHKRYNIRHPNEFTLQHQHRLLEVANESLINWRVVRMANGSSSPATNVLFTSALYLPTFHFSRANLSSIIYIHSDRTSALRINWC